MTDQNPPQLPPWQPRPADPQSRDPLPVPYLETAPSAPIAIDTGRQLFVDDYLVQATDLTRTYHAAQPHPAAPVLSPQTELEMNGGRCPVAAPFNDGVWYDPADQLFKLWYHAGWFDGTALAISRDGLHWERPRFDVIPGTNAVIAPRPGHRRDGGLVWLDEGAPADERFKMFLFFRGPDTASGYIYTSPDGIHWRERGPTGPCGDNSSFFYNAFRRRYVFSIRQGWQGWSYRARAYCEGADFAGAAQWDEDEPIPWARADRLDRPDPLVGDGPQLYDLNAVAYESLLLGAHALFYGPQNEVCAQIGQPKFIDLQMAYSRDGFHWQRPVRTAFIPCSRRAGTWDYGYIHAAGGICLVVGDELWFYYGAFAGQSPALQVGQEGAFGQQNSMYAGGHTGLATLRRDGFASVEAGEQAGQLTTRPVVFSGCYLFVNVDNPQGELRVEVLDEKGRAIAPFTGASCRPLAVDSTRIQVRWEGADDLAGLRGRPVCFRFHLRGGALYAFWVSPSTTGASRGFVAAGGPGLAGAVDG